MISTFRLGIVAVWLAAVVCNDASGQTLCGVAKVAIQNDGFDLAFHGMKDSAILAIADNQETTLELKSGVLAATGKRLPGPLVKQGTKLYYAAGLHKSCILHAITQNDKPGLYIEQHSHVHGQPPQLHTEFIEAD